LIAGNEALLKKNKNKLDEPVEIRKGEEERKNDNIGLRRFDFLDVFVIQNNCLP